MKLDHSTQTALNKPTQ